MISNSNLFLYYRLICGAKRMLVSYLKGNISETKLLSCFSQTHSPCYFLHHILIAQLPNLRVIPGFCTTTTYHIQPARKSWCSPFKIQLNSSTSYHPHGDLSGSSHLPGGPFVSTPMLQGILFSCKWKPEWVLLLCPQLIKFFNLRKANTAWSSHCLISCPGSGCHLSLSLLVSLAGFALLSNDSPHNYLLPCVQTLSVAPSWAGLSELTIHSSASLPFSTRSPSFISWWHLAYNSTSDSLIFFSVFTLQYQFRDGIFVVHPTSLSSQFNTSPRGSTQ